MAFITSVQGTGRTLVVQHCCQPSRVPHKPLCKKHTCSWCVARAARSAASSASADCRDSASWRCRMATAFFSSTFSSASLVARAVSSAYEQHSTEARKR
jgi:hypothetical protein